MKVFNIGRKGNQRFSLENQEKVNDLHARVTIDDNGVWMIEDLGSINGTFIINGKGELVEVKRKRIDEFTRIVLADTSFTGASFYAHHLLEEDEDNYRKEFHHMAKEYSKLVHEKDLAVEKMKERRLLLSLVPVLTSTILGVLTRVIFRDDPNIIYIIIGMMSAVTATLNVLITWINNRDKSLEPYKKRMQYITMCPHCGRQLSDFDIKNQQCPVCKTHA